MSFFKNKPDGLGYKEIDVSQKITERTMRTAMGFILLITSYLPF